jgi:transposase-like protein
VIALVVLWRLRYRLTLRDLAEMFLVRGFVFSHEAVREALAGTGRRASASPARQGRAWPSLLARG